MQIANPKQLLKVYLLKTHMRGLNVFSRLFFSRSDYIELYFEESSEPTQRIVKILFLVERVMNSTIPDYFLPRSL